jgi:hypothetical protein
VGGNRTAAAPSIDEEDLGFLEEQARHALESGAWEKLGGDTLQLRLKASSWYERVATVMAVHIARVLFLFHDRRDLLALRQSGRADPPDGTIFAEFVEGRRPSYQMITERGWVPVDRVASRLLALTLAAISAAATSSEPEVSGELVFPGGARGRYSAKRVPPDPKSPQGTTGIPRFDLYGGEDCTRATATMEWEEYESLRRRAEQVETVGEPFQDPGAPIPVFLISGSRQGLGAITGRLREARPKGIILYELEGTVVLVAEGLKDTYILTTANQDQAAIRMWGYEARANGGAHAIMVTDTAPTREDERWEPSTVAAVFELGKQRDR